MSRDFRIVICLIIAVLLLPGLFKLTFDELKAHLIFYYFCYPILGGVLIAMVLPQKKAFGVLRAVAYFAAISFGILMVSLSAQDLITGRTYNGRYDICQNIDPMLFYLIVGSKALLGFVSFYVNPAKWTRLINYFEASDSLPEKGTEAIAYFASFLVALMALACYAFTAFVVWHRPDLLIQFRVEALLVWLPLAFGLAMTIWSYSIICSSKPIEN
jgi:hypothetical protein